MSRILSSFIFLLFCQMASATVDAYTSAWIVVKDLQQEDQFWLKQVPIIGCFGLPQGPTLEQFVSPYRVRATMGCGYTQAPMKNINELSCAKVLSTVENSDYASFGRIVLDISKCQFKNNARYITLVRTAAARNFPQTKNGKVQADKEVELILKK